MRANSNLILIGQRILLVPYRKEHVLKYHEWMQDPALQEATASEPLTLEEEYEMQTSWLEDEKKCTFIILDRELDDTPGTGVHKGGMVGDVNLFWNDHDEANTAEIEIMIAEVESRRKGLASEALKLFMAYAVTELGVTRFKAKIGDANSASQKLFHSLGYIQTGRSEVFQEITLELAAAADEAAGGTEDPSAWQALLELGAQLEKGVYDS